MMLPGETPSQTVARLSHMLQVPRKGLIYSAGGSPLLSVVAPSGLTTDQVIDAANGPTPGPLIVQTLKSEVAWQISLSVEAHVVDCPEGQKPNYLSHRWTETMDVDRHAMTKRTRQGTIVTRSDLIKGTSPDILRGLVAPGLEPDFIRTSSSYTLSPDGLQLSYRFVDEEQYLMPPDGASEAEGEFFVYAGRGGANRAAECRVRLRSSKDIDKGTLISRCMSICLAKINAAGPLRPEAGNVVFKPNGKIDNNTPNPPPFIEDLSIGEVLYRNEVEVRARARLQPVKDKAGVNVNMKPFAVKPAYSELGSVQPFDPGLRGTAQLAMVAAALQDPCLRQTITLTPGQIPDQATPSTGHVAATVTISPVQPNSSDAELKTGEPGIYSVYDIRTRIVRDEHMLQLPVGKAGADAAVIQLAAPTHRRVVEWSAEKLGAPPKVPNPNPAGGSNAVLLEAHFDPGQMDVGADGETLRYVCSGRYEYAFRNSDKVRLAAGVPPWLTDDVRQQAAQPFLYADGIFDVNGDGFAGGTVTLKPGPSSVIGPINLENR
jgi:hypothetical protein